MDPLRLGLQVAARRAGDDGVVVKSAEVWLPERHDAEEVVGRLGAAMMDDPPPHVGAVLVWVASPADVGRVRDKIRSHGPGGLSRCCRGNHLASRRCVVKVASISAPLGEPLDTFQFVIVYGTEDVVLPCKITVPHLKVYTSTV